MSVGGGASWVGVCSGWRAVVVEVGFLGPSQARLVMVMGQGGVVGKFLLGLAVQQSARRNKPPPISGVSALSAGVQQSTLFSCSPALLAGPGFQSERDAL